MRAETVKSIARECGFELAGIAPIDPGGDFARYQQWVARGMAGEMRYLTDRRAEVRRDVRNLLPTARSVICVGKLYNTPDPPREPGDARISRYAWGKDYHVTMRAALERMVGRLLEREPFEWKICVDTAPLLERSFARLAGLGWIGKNTCLINEPLGSWFFLGEIVTSMELEPGCTAARPLRKLHALHRGLSNAGDSAIDRWLAVDVDARRCISYLTIELRGSIPDELRAGVGEHVFGCDICQDVCPWNSHAPVTEDPAFAGSPIPLEVLATLSPEEFHQRFQDSAIARAKHAGLLRNVAVAIANRGVD